MKLSRKVNPASKMKCANEVKREPTSVQPSKIGFKFWLLVSLVGMNVIPSAAANELRLQLKPSQCVAIHQGKTCYVDIELHWQATSVGEYCLYSSQQTEPLKCWRKANNGLFEREIVARENVLFRLRETKSGGVTISKELEMAWVYKRNAKARSSWRMF